MAASLRPAGIHLIDREKRYTWLRGLNPQLQWIMPKQLHGAAVISEPVISDDLVNRCDGLVSGNPTLGLAVFGSDCPSVIVAGPTVHGIAHCGWRGVAGGIVKNLVSAMADKGQCSTSELTMFTGPGICVRC